MPKISVIVPVYNTEDYIEKCLNSIIMQNVGELEVIVVNDGSTDNSANIIKKFINKYACQIKYFEKTNGGLSDARNYGVSKATGEYICFVDSDDYIDKDLFIKLEKYMSESHDLIKFKCVKINEKNEIIEKVDGPIFECKTGEEAFNDLYSKDVLIEPAWLYLYKREFFLKHHFQFPVGKYHEDWAIVPFILLRATSVASTDLYGYYYVQSANSITRNNCDEKIKKRAYNMLEHYDRLIQKLSEIKISKLTEENFKIYMTNCLILKLEELPAQYHKQYLLEIKKRKLYNNIKARNIKQLLKRFILKVDTRLYLKFR